MEVILGLGFWLLLVHLVYDFHIQGSFIAENKSKYPFILFIHCLTYAMLMATPIGYYADSFITTWAALLLFVTHMIADGVAGMMKNPGINDLYWNQLAHGITIVAVLLFIVRFGV